MEPPQETTTTILGNSEDTIELSPLDHFVTTFACIPWSTFYSYDVSGAKLKTALERIAVSYPVLCGRLKTKPESRVEIVVTKDAGFSFTETTSDCTLAEAISQARVTEQPAAFPSFAILPFFCAQMVTPATIDQDAPLLMVKLTHFKDGTSCVAATVHHTVADAQRLGELMADISVAYRGEELRKVDHDRSQGWPDTMLQKVPLEMDPKDFPRKVTTPFDQLPLPTYPEETYAVESLYFPMEALKGLKKKIMEGLKDGEYVSMMDVVTAVVWMLHGELAAVREGKTDVQTAEDLKIFQSFFLYFIDLVSNNSPLITENFFGNAYFGTVVAVPEAASEDQKKIGLAETVAFVAGSIRKHVLMMKTPPAQVMSVITLYKALTEIPPYPPLMGGVSSFFKMPFDKMDYGHGAPVFNYALPAYPFADIWGGICPMTNNKGVVIQKIVRSQDKPAVINSAVLKALVPGYAVLSEKKPDELAALLGL